MAVGSASCGAVGRRQPQDTLGSAGRYWCSFAFFTSVLSCSPPTHAQPEFKDAGIPSVYAYASGDVRRSGNTFLWPCLSAGVS